MTIHNISALEKYQTRFVANIPQTPTLRYVSVFLLRESKSYAIFTTEGGEQQDIEETQAGLESSKRIARLVLFKRKQVAPERRTGKALLRQYGVFPYAIVSNDSKVEQVIYGDDAVRAAVEDAKGKKNRTVEPKSDCVLTENLCTHCPDCLTYGYAAVEGEGARKARVMTDSCFSVRPYPLIQKRMKFNVINERKHTSETITEYDYTMPEVYLPSVVTTVDLTSDEFVYVLGNILRTARYGKESTRQGAMRNHILALAFSDMEPFSNLEFTQAFYDAFTADPEIDLVNGSLTRADFEKHGSTVLRKLTAHAPGRLELVQGEDLEAILGGVRDLNRDEIRLSAFLRDLNTQSASFSVA